MRLVELRPPRRLLRAIQGLEGDQTFDGAARVVDQAAARVAGRSRVGSILRGDWLGHALHPVLSDLPLGCWTAAAILDLTTSRRGNPVAQRLIATGLLFAAPTAAAGLAEFGTLTDQRSRRVAVVHAAGNAVAMGLYLVSWRARRHGHHLVGKAASTLGGVAAIGTGYLGGHLSFVLGAGGGERGRDSAAIAPPEHAAEPQPAAPANAEVSRHARPATSAAEVAASVPRPSAPGVQSASTDHRVSPAEGWPTVGVVTPAVTDDQQRALRELPYYVAESESEALRPTSDEMHTAFHFPPQELTLENLRALSAEASRIAGAARLVYRDEDPDVMQLVETANAG
jgi:uncharacterized membrane protein